MAKVVIVGNGNGWDKSPTAENSAYTVWGITSQILWKHVDLSIDMNVYEDLRWGKGEQIRNQMVIDRCGEFNIPYIGLHNYPLDEIVEQFDTDYFSSTVDYAIALALHQNFTEIELHGVTLDPSSEYKKLQAGINFWCGVAKGMGVKLTVHGKNSIVMRTEDGLLYGYDRPQKEVPWES